MANSPIPFAEGAPNDSLQVEDFGEDEVLIGDPDLDAEEVPDSQFEYC